MIQEHSQYLKRRKKITKYTNLSQHSNNRFQLILFFNVVVLYDTLYILCDILFKYVTDTCYMTNVSICHLPKLIYILVWTKHDDVDLTLLRKWSFTQINRH